MLGAIHEAWAKKKKNKDDDLDGSKCRKSHQDLPKVKSQPIYQNQIELLQLQRASFMYTYETERDHRPSSEDMRDWPANCMVAQGAKREKKNITTRISCFVFFNFLRYFFKFFMTAVNLSCFGCWHWRGSMLATNRSSAWRFAWFWRQRRRYHWWNPR